MKRDSESPVNEELGPAPEVEAELDLDPALEVELDLGSEPSPRLGARNVIEILEEKMETQKLVTIDGVDIYFPYEPYEIQKEYMKKVIESLSNKCYAALESPTGTGKTLCLLCSTMGWVNSQKERRRIFFATRTHSQISSVIKELNKTCYNPRIAILSSRKRSCIVESCRKIKNDKKQREKCQVLRKDEEMKPCWWVKELCPYNVKKMVDLEDLVKMGKEKKFCPYYNEKMRMKESDVVFLPYNYILNPAIKDCICANLTNNIVIFDEGHNISSVCEEIGNRTFDETLILSAIKGVKSAKIESQDYLNKNSFPLEKDKKPTEELDISSYLPSSDGEDLSFDDGKSRRSSLSFSRSPMKFKDKKYSKEEIERSLVALEECEKLFQKVYDKLKNFNIKDDSFNRKLKIRELSIVELREFYIDESTQTIFDKIEPGHIIDDYKFIKSFLKGISKPIPMLKRMEKERKKFCNDFKFFLHEKQVKKKNITSNIKIISWMCSNPGLYFKNIVLEYPNSVILTSGTLPAAKILESELDCDFKVTLQNDHIISPDQVFFTTLTKYIATDQRKTKKNFCFNYANRENKEMLYFLGEAIAKFSEIIPGGILVFFTSYSFLSNCREMWTAKGLIDKIKKKIFYLDKIENSEENEKDDVNKNIINAYLQASKEGAILFSVFRNAYSEGINFSGDAARLGILVGIPFPKLDDLRVIFKQEYFDNKAKENKKEITGREWYSNEAFMAINQSLGRVIRNKDDFGAIVCIDCRYNEYNVNKGFSKWIRKFFKTTFGWEECFSGMEKFFLKKK